MKSWDILVVGGGHAGIEAALAAARRGLRAALLTLDADALGVMPCNPAVGGLGKGHLVREIDALGGEMGRAIDATGIQFRLLNRSKGPAVRSPRAQADKLAYQRHMTAVVSGEPGLDLLEGEAVELLVDSFGAGKARVAGVLTAAGDELHASRVVLCAGTFMRGLMHVGSLRSRGGRLGSSAAGGLSESLAGNGVELMRLKTGTPPRLLERTIDFSRTTAQPGDPDPDPFSFRTVDFNPSQVLCHITRTTAETHGIISTNIDKSPLYGGIIEGAGPRYCPSIEDKVIRFADKDSHHVFLEPEGLESEEIYVNGLSTSLPAEVQEAFIRSVPGLEEAVLLRHGYAVEYDSVPSWQVDRALELKNLPGLYLAGQILGTSGYEEAAAQGLVAGINAAFSLQGEDPLIFGRYQAYIGVLIDDLVTKEITEPYRMFTSRAEHRLSLRCDNVAGRMLPHAERMGLLPAAEMELLRGRAAAAVAGRNLIAGIHLDDPGPAETSLAGAILRRPAGDPDLAEALARLPRKLAEDGFDLPDRLLRDSIDQAVIDIRYEGYVAKQERLLRRQAHLDELEIPAEFPYKQYGAISFEAREKLDRMRPRTLGQAGRIDGVRTSDLAIISILVRRFLSEASSDESADENGPAHEPTAEVRR